MSTKYLRKIILEELKKVLKEVEDPSILDTLDNEYGPGHSTPLPNKIYGAKYPTVGMVAEAAMRLCEINFPPYTGVYGVGGWEVDPTVAVKNADAYIAQFLKSQPYNICLLVYNLMYWRYTKDDKEGAHGLNGRTRRKVRWDYLQKFKGFLQQKEQEQSKSQEQPKKPEQPAPPEQNPPAGDMDPPPPEYEDKSVNESVLRPALVREIKKLIKTI